MYVHMYAYQHLYLPKIVKKWIHISCTNVLCNFFSIYRETNHFNGYILSTWGRFFKLFPLKKVRQLTSLEILKVFIWEMSPIESMYTNNFCWSKIYELPWKVVACVHINGSILFTEFVNWSNVSEIKSFQINFDGSNVIGVFIWDGLW
jgi:hypothetical protein